MTPNQRNHLETLKAVLRRQGCIIVAVFLVIFAFELMRDETRFLHSWRPWVGWTMISIAFHVHELRGKP